PREAFVVGLGLAPIEGAAKLSRTVSLLLRQPEVSVIHGVSVALHARKDRWRPSKDCSGRNPNPVAEGNADVFTGRALSDDISPSCDRPGRVKQRHRLADSDT